MVTANFRLAADALGDRRRAQGVSTSRRLACVTPLRHHRGAYRSFGRTRRSAERSSHVEPFSIFCRVAKPLKITGAGALAAAAEQRRSPMRAPSRPRPGRRVHCRRRPKRFPARRLASPVKNGDEVIAPINALAKKFVNVIQTQDWHTKGHISFASFAHGGKKPFETTELSYGTQVLWPDHCVQGSQRRGLLRQARIAGIVQLVIRKGFHPQRRQLFGLSGSRQDDPPQGSPAISRSAGSNAGVRRRPRH